MENLVYDQRISTVVPARFTAEDKRIYELTNMDLAVKLHYIRGVYFFENKAVEGLSILDLKRPFFLLLNTYFPVAGRIWWPGNGGARPVIKCNDCGVRIVEAQSGKSLKEWMEMIKDDYSHNDHLVYKHALGPDLSFSPLVFVQFTSFQCGGMSVGLSWSHVLGDVFTASTFIDTWAQILGGQLPRHHTVNTSSEIHKPSSFPMRTTSSSLKRVGPVGDYWVPPSECKMKTHFFHISEQKLKHLLKNICGLSPSENIRAFEYICAILWKCLAKIRKELMSSHVTICTNNSHDNGTEILPRNSQVVSTVECNSSVFEVDLVHLAGLIAKNQFGEQEMMEAAVNTDFILYGANLTFINLENANMSEMEIKGVKAVYANYTIDGVGDNGVVLVLPEPKDGEKGMRVTMVMSVNEVEELKHELKYAWGII